MTGKALRASASTSQSLVPLPAAAFVPSHIIKCLGVTQLPAGFVPKQPEPALAMLLELCEVGEEAAGTQSWGIGI